MNEKLKEAVDENVRRAIRAHVVQTINKIHTFMYRFPINLIELEAHLKIAKGAAEEEVLKDLLDFHLEFIRELHEMYHLIITKNEEKIRELNQRIAELGEEGIKVATPNEVV